MSDSTGNSPTRRPTDGPATVFESDSHVATLIAIRNEEQHSTKTDSPVLPDEFGLVVVAGWPPSHNTMACYKEFLNLIRKCFDKEDLSDENDQKKSIAAYLYPPQHLHVTVATLHSIAHATYGDSEIRALLKRRWTDIVKKASCRPEWPTRPLEMTIESAQIGKRAGILLWRDLTGGLDQMRLCIRQETVQRQAELKAAGIDVGTLSIPSIAHSTFLRFNRVPETKGETVQERFKKIASPCLQDVFPSPIAMPDAKMVCERNPYMHIPNDDRHVFQVFPLQQDADTRE